MLVNVYTADKEATDPLRRSVCSLLI